MNEIPALLKSIKVILLGIAVILLAIALGTMNFVVWIVAAVGLLLAVYGMASGGNPGQTKRK